MNACRSRFFSAIIRGGRAAPLTSKSLIPQCVSHQIHVPNYVVPRFASTTRRRRGNGGMSPGDKEERAAPHVAVKDPAIFRQEAGKLLVKIESALRPMEKYNDVFSITLTPRNRYSSGSLTLELAPEDGMYSLEVDDEGMRILFQSAMSGRFNYVLNRSTGEWVDENDGHSFVGMLVRDLIRQCNGLPDL